MKLIILTSLFLYLNAQGNAIRQKNVQDSHLPRAQPLYIEREQPGGEILLYVEPSDTVQSVKFQLDDKEGIPWTQQRLVKSNEFLDDNRTLSSYEIGPGSTIGLVLPYSDGIDVFIDLPFCNLYVNINVGQSSTVEYLIARIAEKTGIIQSRQILMFGADVLKSSHTLKSYKIVQEDTITLAVARFVSNSVGLKSGSEQKNPNTVEELEPQIKNAKTYLPAMRLLMGATIRIFVTPLAESVDGHPFSLEVWASGTIETIKFKIKREKNKKRDQQRLFFSGQELENSRSISDYNIGIGSSLILVMRVPCGTQIYVKLVEAGPTIVLEVNRSDTILEVKGKLKVRTGDAVVRQHLIFNGEELDDSSRLSDYKIKIGSTIFMTLAPEDIGNA